jgi:hypothetical protein
MSRTLLAAALVLLCCTGVHAQTSMPVLTVSVAGQSVTLAWSGYTGELEDQCHIYRTTNGGALLLISDSVYCVDTGYSETVVDGSYTYVLQVVDMTGAALGQSNYVSATVPTAAPTTTPTLPALNPTAEPTAIPAVELTMADILSTTEYLAQHQVDTWNTGADTAPLLGTLAGLVLFVAIMSLVRGLVVSRWRA